MLDALDAVKGTVRLDADEPHVPIHLLQVASDADERAGGPEASDEVRDRPRGLLPDLRPGRLEVSPPVCLVVVLIEIPVSVRLRGRERFGGPLRAIGPVRRGREDQLGPVRLEDALSLRTEVRRHAEGHSVSLRGADHRERDPGVPGGRVQEDPILRQAGPLGGPQHSERGAVLDAATGIAEFRLGIHLHLGRHMGRQSIESEERRVADEVRNARGLRRLRGRTHGIECLRFRRPPSGRGRA